MHPVDYPNKYALLAHLLQTWSHEGQVLVFTRMKSTAAYVCEFLRGKGFSADDLHGDKAQKDRTKSLERFRKKDIQILVATNVAARGLDIVGVTHVVNFDVPDDPKDYVHRVGRTARGVMTGDAVTLMSTHEILLVKDIERLMDKRVSRQVVAGFEPSFQDNVAAESSGESEPVDKPARSRLSRGRRDR